MFKQFSTKTLIFILVILSLAIAMVFLMDKKNGGRTIREELVRIDTSSVTSISLFPQSEKRVEIKILKNGKQWIVQKEKISAEADIRNIINLLNEFALIKPQRLASTEKSKWKDYGVNDSLGTRLKFYSGEKLLSDVVVGRFTFNNTTRSAISYIRLFNEEETYAMDGYISIAVNQPFNQWRNKVVIKEDKNNFTRFCFKYPADSGFVLSKENNKWKIGDENCDSAKVEQFLASMTMINCPGFVDNYIPAMAPLLTLTVEGNNMNALSITAFPADPVQRYVIHSSYNPAAYFSAKDYRLDENIFKSKTYFFPSIQPKKKATKKK